MKPAPPSSSEPDSGIRTTSPTLTLLRAAEALIPGAKATLSLHAESSAHNIPLLSDGETLGMLNLHLNGHSLTEAETLAINLLADQAASLLIQSRHIETLERDLARKDEELHQLRRASVLISSRPRLDETLDTILQLALEITNAQYGIFRLLDASGESLVTRAVSSDNLARPLVEKLPLSGKSIMAQVGRTRTPILVTDLRQEPWASMYYPLDSKLEMRAELAVPLINASGRLEGVLNLESPALGAFSEDDSYLLQSLAAYAVTAIQEVRLLDALQDAAQLLVSQPSRAALDQLCGMANTLLNASSSAIWLTNEVGEFRLASQAGDVNAAEVFSSDSVPTGGLTIPLRAGGGEAQVLGMFGVAYPASGEERSAASEWDKKVLSCLANYAVLAIQNESHQQALRASREQHLLAETFAAVGDISANLLHNMNNKVGIIPARVQAIQDKYRALLESDAYLARNLSEIERSASDAMQIVQENVLHLRPIRAEKVFISACVADAVRAVQPPADVQLTTSGLNDLPMVIAGRQSLTFVFRNLIENAISAMQGSGSILVQGASANGWVDVSVADDGPGIVPELHDQIFELNVSGRGAPGKLGFGLWWVKNLITRLGGSVTVESDGTHGTTFRLRLPAELS